MNDTKKAKTRGRPRGFDVEEAIAKAQALFHKHGYDAVSLADLTDALGINPPSFYSAFGSKADLYARALERYAKTEGLDFKRLLAPDRPLGDSLAALFEAAAESYTAHPEAPGCLVIEGAHGTVDAVACQKATTLWQRGRAAVRDAIARSEPERADTITDYIMAVLTGISASARDGLSKERLLGIARLASLPFA
ncbi:TetR/AcrR family transcriptional regulator [Sinorhizobium numidicum]|uniref:TetR/AcrR family transcriptional regulator n=1 Tax=Sinorhizobium numidicum TaxID=680248 RepID=A0ABY8CP36_9HYPH|nr:TetR/AcrR family transcriptional regulator [Sinorhizobium numidicum]WEX74430.1 TetR/AcrR family transcriptional regulator [Sinorhizobium numidicum]WEX80418.1 TetR/AcrR family transcriptional regulator [Sinorhizobium numidicum]